MTLFPGGKQKNLTKRRQGENDDRRATAVGLSLRALCLLSPNDTPIIEVVMYGL